MRTRSLPFGELLLPVTAAATVAPSNTSNDGIATGGHDPAAFVSVGDAVAGVHECGLSRLDANILTTDAAWAAGHAGR